MHFLELVLNFIDQQRTLIWAMVVVAAVGSCVMLPGLEFNDSPERWMPKDTEEGWKVFDSHFDVGDTIAVGLHFKRPITEDDLPRLRDLRKQFEAIKGIKQVYDTSLVAEEIEATNLTTLLDPANASKYVLYAGALWDEPTPGKPDRTLVTVCELVFDPDHEDAKTLDARRRRVVSEVERIVNEQKAEARFDGDVDFHLASAIVMMGELEKRARQVVFTFLPASIFIGMLSLWFSFRTWRTLFVAVLGSLLAILLVLGWLAAGGGTLGVVTVATPALISIIGVASTMHFAEYAADYGTTGETRDRTRLVSWVAVPCLGAAATTAVGFLMLAFNQLGPVRDLGMQLFVGSLLAFFGIFIVSQVIPIRNASQGVVLTHSRFRRYTSAVTTRPVFSSTLLAAVAGVLFYFAYTGLHVNADPFSFFNKDQPIAKALAHFSDRRFGVYMLDVVLVPKEYAPSPEGGKPEDPVYKANRQRAAEFSDVILRDGKDKGVMRVVSTEAFLQRQRQFQIDLDRVRREEGIAAFAAKVVRVGNQQKRFGSTFQSWSHDKQEQGAMRLTFLAHEQGIDGFGPLLELTRKNLPYDRFDCYLCGSIAQVVDLGNGLIGGILMGLGSSVIIIAVLCGFMFRSVKMMLLALPPNLFPVLVLYGVMGMFQIPLSAGSAMVATIALGIAVNDTMHFVLHYQRFRNENGFGTRRALVQTIGDLGRPIVLTSVVHIAGFTVFLLTDFQPLFHFGLLSSAAMIAAMLGDLFMLPNLLMLFDYATDRPDMEPAHEHHAPHGQPQSIS